MKISSYIISAITALAFFSACVYTNEGSDGGNILVRVGKAKLTLAQLCKSIPAGLSPEDSTAMARQIINQWIDDKLITEVVAPTIPDIDEINRMTDEYRSRLIADSYRSRMYHKNGDLNISEDSLRSYYERFKGSLLLNTPVIKGVFLKFADDSPALAEARSLFKSSRQSDIDRIEKLGYDGAVHYDYFRDRWVDWQKMMALIPADFGSSPLTFPASNRSVELSVDGFTYLLCISDFRSAGSSMPYEYAREYLRDAILYERQKEYDEALRQQLKGEAIDNGTLVIY